MARRKRLNTLDSNQNNNEVTMTQAVQEVETAQTELDLVRQELEATKREVEEKKQELKYMDRRAESAVKEIMVNTRGEGLSDKIARQKAIDDQIVTGKFINRRAPGSSVKLLYQKYADCATKWWEFEDGKVYDIPRGFADQINEHYYRPSFTQKTTIMDPNRPASAIHEVDTSNKLYSFVPVNF